MYVCMVMYVCIYIYNILLKFETRDIVITFVYIRTYIDIIEHIIGRSAN